MIWTNGPDMIHPRKDFGCTLVQSIKKTESQVIVVGGKGSDPYLDGLNTVESLQRNSNKWMSEESIPEDSLHWHAVTPSNSPEFLLYSIGGSLNNFYPIKKIYGLSNFPTAGKLLQTWHLTVLIIQV